MDLALDLGAEEIAPEVLDAINGCAHDALDELPPAYAALVKSESIDAGN